MATFLHLASQSPVWAKAAGKKKTERLYSSSAAVLQLSLSLFLPLIICLTLCISVLSQLCIHSIRFLISFNHLYFVPSLCFFYLSQSVLFTSYLVLFSFFSKWIKPWFFMEAQLKHKATGKVFYSKCTGRDLQISSIELTVASCPNVSEMGQYSPFERNFPLHAHGLEPLKFKAALPFMHLCVKSLHSKEEERVETRPPSVGMCYLLLFLSPWKSICWWLAGGFLWPLYTFYESCCL